MDCIRTAYDAGVYRALLEAGFEKTAVVGDATVRVGRLARPLATPQQPALGSAPTMLATRPVVSSATMAAPTASPQQGGMAGMLQNRFANAPNSANIGRYNPQIDSAVRHSDVSLAGGKIRTDFGTTPKALNKSLLNNAFMSNTRPGALKNTQFHPTEGWQVARSMAHGVPVHPADKAITGTLDTARRFAKAIPQAIRPKLGMLLHFLSSWG